MAVRRRLERGFRVLPATQRASAAAFRDFGGVVGDAILRVPVVLFHTQLAGTPRLVVALVLGFAALMTFGLAAGIIFAGEVEHYDDGYAAEDEDEDEEDAEKEAGDHAWISLGFIEHHLLSFRAWLGRALFHRERTPLPSRDAAARRRIEPRFEGGGRADADEADDEGEDDEESAPRARKPRAPAKPPRGAPAQASSRRRSIFLPRRAPASVRP